MFTPMRADRIGPLLNRTYLSSHPCQWAREAYENGRQANATRIEFDVEWQAVEALGVYRRRISDNGDGMTPEQMPHFLNTFGGGGKPIGDIHENYGVGLKTSVLPWNKSGLVVISLRDGVESMVWLQHDAATGEYGMRDFKCLDPATGEEAIENVIPPCVIDGFDWSKAMPVFVREAGHGTTLVFLGNDPKDDTVSGDPSRPDEKKTYAVRFYLNTRLLHVPKGFEIWCLEFSSIDKKRWPKKEKGHQSGSGAPSHRRPVVGALRSILKPTAKKPKLAIGKLEVPASQDRPAAKVHWMLWQEERPNMFSGHYPVDGYIGVTYRNELYDRTDQIAAYRHFGINHKPVRDRLWLIVEPEEWDSQKRSGVYPDQSRSRLLISGGRLSASSLPMSEWGEYFAMNQPKEIVEAIQAAVSGQVGSIGNNQWRERLMERFGSRWRMPRLVTSTAGKIMTAAAGIITRSTQPRGSNGGGGGSGNGGGGGNTLPQAPTPTLQPVVQGAVQAVKASTTASLPEFRICNMADMDEPNMLCEYVNTNAAEVCHVRINQEHPAIKEVIKTWQDAYPAQIATQVAQEVVTVYGEVAVSKVAHLAHYRGVYTPAVINEMLKPAALTLAMLGLMAEDSIIATRLGGKHGKRRSY